MADPPVTPAPAAALAAALEAAADAVVGVQQRFRKLSSVSADAALAAAVELYAAVAPRPAPRPYFEAVPAVLTCPTDIDFRAETKKMLADQAAEKAAREALVAAAAVEPSPAPPPEPEPATPAGPPAGVGELLIRTSVLGGCGGRPMWVRRPATHPNEIEWVYRHHLDNPTGPPSAGDWRGCFSCELADPADLGGRFRPLTDAERAEYQVTAPPGELARLAAAVRSAATKPDPKPDPRPDPKPEAPAPVPADPAVGYGMGNGTTNGAVLYRIAAPARGGDRCTWVEFDRRHRVTPVPVSVGQCREYFRPLTPAERAENNLPAPGPVEAALWPAT